MKILKISLVMLFGVLSCYAYAKPETAPSDTKAKAVKTVQQKKSNQKANSQQTSQQDKSSSASTSSIKERVVSNVSENTVPPSSVSSRKASKQSNKAYGLSGIYSNPYDLLADKLDEEDQFDFDSVRGRGNYAATSNARKDSAKSSEEKGSATSSPLNGEELSKARKQKGKDTFISKYGAVEEPRNREKIEKAPQKGQDSTPWETDLLASNGASSFNNTYADDFDLDSTLTTSYDFLNQAGDRTKDNTRFTSGIPLPVGGKGEFDVGLHYVKGRLNGIYVEDSDFGKKYADWVDDKYGLLTLNVSYSHPIGKRTSWYGYAGYTAGNKLLPHSGVVSSIFNGPNSNSNGYAVQFGVKHKF